MEEDLCFPSLVPQDPSAPLLANTQLFGGVMSEEVEVPNAL